MMLGTAVMFLAFMDISIGSSFILNVMEVAQTGAALQKPHQHVYLLAALRRPRIVSNHNGLRHPEVFAEVRS
jgi:hypothetical protein